MAYAMYLRKSRADMEAEARGEGETLARHKSILTALAKKQGLEIGEIYQEIVSGETLAARPEARRLLGDVMAERWEGVLVMEVERLARGDTIDQGTVARAFTSTGTLIVTPIKTYDPNNEFDEEYFEFSLFMSRREYKTIRRRMQAGRTAAAQEGKFIGSIPPYGYRRIKTVDGHTLEPDPVEAPVVQSIYEWYVHGVDGERLGMSKIARRLNGMGIPARRGVWTAATLCDMIVNPVYIGKIRWNTKGKPRSRRPEAQKILADGLHPALVDEDTFFKACEIIASNRPAAVPSRSTPQSPFTGLAVCGKCGRKMVRRAYTTGSPPSLMCTCNACDNVSAYMHIVEAKLLDFMRQWLDEYMVSPAAVEKDGAAEEQQIKALDALIAQAQAQRTKLYDLLERGIYTDQEYMMRAAALKDRLKGLEAERKELAEFVANVGAHNAAIRDFIPQWEYVLEAYPKAETATEKNELLKSVLEKFVYTREGKGGRWSGVLDDFSLQLYPKLPKSPME